MGRRYPDIKAGEWVRPTRKYFIMVCCDCGLAHKIEFRTQPSDHGKGRRIIMRAWRDNRATGQIRRHKV